MKGDTLTIDIERLVIGLFVDLELGWTDHPFLFSKFRIRTRAEINQIKALGLTKVKVIVKKSKASAIESLKKPIPLTPDSEEEPEVSEDLWDQKKESLAKAEAFKKEHRRAVQQYQETQKRIGNLTRNLRMAPANAIRDAEEVIADIRKLLGEDSHLVVSMVNLSSDVFSMQHHALNVTVLSLALGRSIGLSDGELHHLGVGSILHDIGKIMLPQNLLHKETEFTPAELKVMQTHVGQGLKMISRLDNFPAEVQEIIAHHHAYLDGSGHPDSTESEDISKLCRIMQVANHYDNMCNPRPNGFAYSPKIAMAKLFAEFDGKLDSEMVHRFVRNLGVYPPGTVVQLNDGSIAVVISVNTESLLSPRILIYNPDIPAKQALMIELEEHSELSISHALKPGEYPVEVQDYLGLEDRVGYFISKPN